MKIAVLSKNRIKQLTKESSKQSKDGYWNDAIFISINGFTHWDGQYNEESPVDKRFKDKTCYLYFDDATPTTESCEDSLKLRGYDKQALEWHAKKYKLFSFDDATTIVDFLRKNLTPSINKIIVHCTAGISRSGAVGTVLNEYYNRFLDDNKEDWNWFYSEGCERIIDPNPYVKSIMMKALGMNYD